MSRTLPFPAVATPPRPARPGRARPDEGRRNLLANCQIRRIPAGPGQLRRDAVALPEFSKTRELPIFLTPLCPRVYFGAFLKGGHGTGCFGRFSAIDRMATIDRGRWAVATGSP